MKGRWLLAIVVANLVVLIGLAFAYPQLMVSPGPLVPGHTELNTDCFACHAPLRGVASARCIACHAVPDIGLRTTMGVLLAHQGLKQSFHQELIEQDCMACHIDHAEPKFTRRSPKRFSHELLKASVRDRCDACHSAPTDRLHSLISGNCAQCHRQEAWKPATFDHDRFFVLDRDHDVGCTTCHANGDVRRYTCFGCLEHTPDKVRREHLKEGIRDFENCVKCHRDPGAEPERPDRTQRRRGSEPE